MRDEQKVEQRKEFTYQVRGIVYGEIGWGDMVLLPEHRDPVLFKEKAKQGHTNAQNRLATCYFEGYQVQQDSGEAIMWLEKAAECGDFEAQVRLTNYYFFGKGIEQNYTQAVKWLERVAKHVFIGRGHSYSQTEKEAQKNAQCQLAYCYFQGHGVEKNSVIAIDWLKKAAEQSYAPAEISLADCYFQGIGVDINDDQAVKWLEKAAGLLEHPISLHSHGDPILTYNGDRLAQRKLGFYYLREENYIEAIKWFKEAAKPQQMPSALMKDKELVCAQTELGICYHHAKNDDLAFDTFEKLSNEYDGFVHLWLAYLTKKKPTAEQITNLDYISALRGLPTTTHLGALTDPEKDECWQGYDKARNVVDSDQEITESLYKAASGLFLQEDDNNFCDPDMINYALPEGIIDFLEHEKSSPAKVILAIYNPGKEKKYEEYLGQASTSNERDILALYLLGKHYKDKKDKIFFDKATHYFKKIGENIEYSSLKERKPTGSEYPLNTQYWLAFSAKAELNNIKHQKEMVEINIRLEETNQRMQRLVEQFTHSLGNVIFPDTIYQVAERLKNNPECRKDVFLLHEAYHSEIIIKLQGELLRQRYANTNPEKFRQFVRGCRRTSSSSDKIKSIEDILDYAVSRVTARFLNQHYVGLSSIRDRILSKKNVSLNALKQKFEDDILLNKSLRPIEWINQNLRPIQITEISPLWKKVFILSESHAEALLFGYFSEILFNAFKYADHDKDEFLTLDFDEKTINDSTYLFCNWENPVKDKAPSMLCTGKGLDAIQEDLKQLNDTENPEESLLISQQKNQFQVTLFFKKDLLVNELPSLKIKRKADAE